MKLCKDCKSCRYVPPQIAWGFISVKEMHLCKHPELVDPVDGTQEFCGKLRSDRCGSEGKYFEKKELSFTEYIEQAMKVKK